MTDCECGQGRVDRCVIYVDRGGENTIVSVIDAALNFDPIAADALERRIAFGDWIVLQGNLRANMTSACLALAKANGAATALNPSPAYPAAEYDWSLVDLVVLNRGEAVALGARQDPVESARVLLAAGAETVVLTLGADGAVLMSSRETLQCDSAASNGDRHDRRGRRLLRNARRRASGRAALGRSVVCRRSGGGDLRNPRGGACLFSNS